ncbi:hypothetical protein AB5J49_03130 [Streptomyces sp. R28]|uniref:Uncharacterized protein n=1 Tax=Streptomyces sp. R28 TaxID=3238628 RepID=A0AB39PNF6_9ACTN
MVWPAAVPLAAGAVCAAEATEAAGVAGVAVDVAAVVGAAAWVSPDGMASTESG